MTQHDDTPAKDERRIFILRTLDQVRVLADALRVRIIEAYGGEARTTKQLASILGEKPSKLYHHVDALERVGLIRLESTRQNRGTIEKYYRPVADMFKADPQLFSSDETDTPSAVETLVDAAFEGAAEEVRDLFRGGDGGLLESEGLLSRCRIKGSRQHAHELRDQLETWLQEKVGDNTPDEDDEDDAGSWGLLIAFYPLARPKKPPEDP